MHKTSQKNLFTPAKLFATNQGFTLIELLVGITIVGILVSVGQTTFKRFKFVAARAEAKLNIKSIESLVAIRVSEDPITGAYLQGQYGYNTAGGSFHNKDPDLNDRLFENGESIGFRVSDPSKLRYYYYFNSSNIIASRGKSSGVVTQHGNPTGLSIHSNYGDISGLDLENCSREDTRIGQNQHAGLFVHSKEFLDRYMIYINEVHSRPPEIPIGQLVQTSNYLDYCTF